MGKKNRNEAPLVVEEKQENENILVEVEVICNCTIEGDSKVLGQKLKVTREKQNMLKKLGLIK